MNKHAKAYKKHEKHAKAWISMSKARISMNYQFNHFFEYLSNKMQLKTTQRGIKLVKLVGTRRVLDRDFMLTMIERLLKTHDQFVLPLCKGQGSSLFQSFLNEEDKAGNPHSKWNLSLSPIVHPLSRYYPYKM